MTFGYDGSSQTSRVQVSTSETYNHPLLDEPITFASSQAVYYAYDALGRLVRRNQDGATTAAATELFFHDRQSQQVVLETDGAGAVATRYVLDSTGSPIGQQKGAVFGWYVTDLRTNLTQVLDGAGAVKSVFGYDPFGAEKSQLTSVSGGFDSRLRYQMAPRDKTVGMYALGPRLLDPAINRFVGADFYVAAAANMQLALDPLTGNRYLYAGANPAGYIDDGHWPCFKCWWRTAAGWAGNWMSNWQHNLVNIGLSAGAALSVACVVSVVCGASVGTGALLLAALAGAGFGTHLVIASRRGQDWRDPQFLRQTALRQMQSMSLGAFCGAVGQVTCRSLLWSGGASGSLAQRWGGIRAWLLSLIRR